jgi:hypothetical protein
MLYKMLIAGLTTGVILFSVLLYRKFSNWWDKRWNKKHPLMRHSREYIRRRRKRADMVSAETMIDRMGEGSHYAAVQPWPEDKDNAS